MIRIALGAFVTALFAASLVAQDEKRELRYRFEKGEQITLVLRQKMRVKLDEVPEAFQGIAPEEPFDNGFDGEIDLEVREVSDKGVATLEGKFRKIASKGSYLGNDFDFAWDRAKDGEPKPDEGDGGGDGPGMPGLGNPEDMLRQLATVTLKLDIDPVGRIKVAGGGGAAGIASQLLDLGGLIGQLPKDKVAVGESWKTTDSLALPGLPLKMKVKGDNTLEKVEKFDGRDCAVIRSKFTVGTEKGDEEEDPELPIPVRPTFKGEGKGEMHFALDAGRPLKNAINLDVKLTVKVPDPQGGEEVEIKGTFKMEQGLSLKKKEY